MVDYFAKHKAKLRQLCGRLLNFQKLQCEYSLKICFEKLVSWYEKLSKFGSEKSKNCFGKLASWYEKLSKVCFEKLVSGFEKSRKFVMES